MYSRSAIVLLGLLYMKPLLAFTCYFTLAKDSCWSNYNVSVDVIDVAKDKLLMTVVVPKEKQWVREKFSCEPAQELLYFARFNPVFWKADEGKKYQALRYWFMPEAIKPGDSAWNISVCYASDFASVPLPPEAKGGCKCDFSTIPVIEPQKN